MAWTTPVTRATGYLVLAADWNNEHVNDLLFLVGPDGSSPPGAFTLWDSTVAGVSFPAASIETPSLSQAFKHLRVVYQAATNGSADTYVFVRINGDTSSSNYFGVHLAVVNAATTPVTDTGNSGLLAGQALPSSDIGAAVNEFEIPDYAAAHRHSIVGSNFDLSNTSGADMSLVLFGQGYDQASAVSTLTFFNHDGSSFVSPTRITVYGEN